MNKLFVLNVVVASSVFCAQTLSAKGGKQLVYNLPSQEEQIRYCTAKIESKQEEIDDYKGQEDLMAARIQNLQKQIDGYHVILESILQGSKDTGSAKAEAIPGVDLSETDLDSYLLALAIQDEEYDQAHNGVAEIKNAPSTLNQEEKAKNPQLKFSGEELVNQVGKYLAQFRDEEKKKLVINGRTYKDFNKELFENRELLELLMLEDPNNPQTNNLNKNIEKLEQEEKKFAEAVNAIFSEEREIQLIMDNFKTSKQQAQAVLGVISGDKDLDDVEVKGLLYTK